LILYFIFFLFYFTLGHPIGASSIPVGKGSLEGNSVPLGGRFPKEGSAFLGTRLSLGKSSVLYLYEIVVAGKKFCILPIIFNSRHSVLKGTP